MQTIPGDWHPGVIPRNVLIDPEAYVETSYSFDKCRSEAAVGMRIGRGASVYLGAMFDIGPAGSVSIGQFALVNGGQTNLTVSETMIKKAITSPIRVALISIAMLPQRVQILGREAVSGAMPRRGSRRTSATGWRKRRTSRWPG